MASTRAALLDLWDTTAWGEMPPEEERLTTQLGVTEGMLYEAFERTRRYRGTGGPSTTVESLAVVRGGKRPEGRLAARELEHRRSCHGAATRAGYSENGCSPAPAATFQR